MGDNKLDKEEILNKRLKEYIKENKHYYDEYEQMYLDGLDAELINRYKNDLPDITRQILEEIGYYDEKPEQSGYNAFIDLIDNEFGLEKNIVEVGSGVIPTLAHKISLKQKSGTITLYDPRLSDYYGETDRFVLKREEFNHKTNIKNADIIIGFMPCEATRTIIETATENNKDFAIVMCEGGPHGDEYDYFESSDEWVDSMLYLAYRGIEDNNMGELKKLSFKKYQSPYPLIYNKIKK